MEKLNLDEILLKLVNSEMKEFKNLYLGKVLKFDFPCVDLNTTRSK